MPIDSLRKRASIASLGLAFLGPSIVPDGSFVAADRQVIANSYYGITASTGGIQVGEVEEEDQPSGGYFWVRYEQEQFRKEEERRFREKAKRKAKRLKDKLDRELALAERKIEDDDARKVELARINRLVASNKQTIIDLGNPVIIKAMNESLEKQTFSTMERLERELGRIYEEEQFLLMATQILVNQ